MAGQAAQLHERSRFVREDGRWYYVRRYALIARRLRDVEGDLVDSFDTRFDTIAGK